MMTTQPNLNQPGTIAVALMATTIAELTQQLRQLQTLTVRQPLVIEWRLDAWHDLSAWSELAQANQQIKQACPDLTLLLTWRTEQPGQPQVSSDRYQDQMTGLIEHLHGDLWDLEVAQTAALEPLRHLLGPTMPIVWSQHFWQPQTRQQLQLALVHAQTWAAPADYLKVATWAASPADCLTLLEATWWAHQRLAPALITMAMGPAGQITRVLGPLFGSAWSFGALTAVGSAPGQLPLRRLDQQLTTLTAAMKGK